MFRVNPYRPGAGLTPLFIAGREEYIKDVEYMFDCLEHNIPVQSVIYSGLRGIGKTVLMNKFYNIANERGIFCEYIEIDGKKDFTSIVSDSIQGFLQCVGIKAKGKPLFQKALDALKSLVLSFNPEDNTFSLSVQEKEFFAVRNYDRSLTQLFTSVGEIAKEVNTPICFIIDEIQYMKQSELSALISALHRTNQLGYPVMLIGAGLPKIIKMLSDAKSYSERLFAYVNIGVLDKSQAEKAIVEPAKQFGTSYTKEAVNEIIKITKGYPFFVQQMCKIVYDDINGNTIELSDVEKNIDKFLKTLDEGFFRSRYERCSDAERLFIFAMVKCGELPCSISNISKELKRSGKSISPTRAKLIDKGIIYATKHGELDFTVPEFSGFIHRLGEYEEWIEINNAESNLKTT